MIAVAGAGWSGAVVARLLANAGYDVTVFESRPHIGGNCYTETLDGVVVHKYGPHIFHTDDQFVWDWLQRWGSFKPYRLQVRSTSRDEVFSLPVNLHTINQIYRQAWTPGEARRQLEPLDDRPVSFEDAAIGAVGETIYRRLFAGYTEKMWGVPPDRLPASVFHRLPVRFDYDDRYYSHRIEVMPVHGYTPIFGRLLDHYRIDVRLSSPFDPADACHFDHVFWTGPLDAWFGYRYGRLGYRSLRFEWETHDDDPQGVALMMWPEVDVPHTRVTCHNYLHPWLETERWVTSTEYPHATQAGDEPFYPVRLVDDMVTLQRYQRATAGLPNVTMLGRLGTYRYIDMDVAIREAFDVATGWLKGELAA